MLTMDAAGELRARLVAVAREWQASFHVAPAITSALSEYDAARLLGMTPAQYASSCNKTAVCRGHDFIFQGKRYQIKGNRPSGAPGSSVTKVPKPKKYEWDFLIWILYDKDYMIQEAWLWPVEEYRRNFEMTKRIHPRDIRRGTRIFPGPLPKPPTLSTM